MTSQRLIGRFFQVARCSALFGAMLAGGCGGSSLGGADGSGSVADGGACDVPPPTRVDIPADLADRTCTFALPRPVNTQAFETLVVDYDHVDGILRADQDPTHVNGWDYTDASRSAIEFFGNGCIAVTSGTVRAVIITYACLLI